MIKLKTFANLEAVMFQTLELFRQVFPDLGENDGVMLSGGRTPLEIYRQASEQGLTTGGKLFLSDERYVPVDDPQSNFGGIAPLFKCPFIPVHTALPIEKAAAAFDDALSRLERIPVGLLGLGADGHTASLFNLQDAALRDERLAIPVKKMEKPDRISVTPEFLNQVERIIILATGAEKKEMIQILLKKPKTIPAGVALSDHRHVEIWTDQPV